MKTLDISVVGLSCVDCIAIGPKGRWGVQNPVGGIRISAGGLGNALVALSGLGLEVGVSTRVGADMYGDFLREQWQELDTSGVRIATDHSTGFAFVLNHGNERTPFYSAGANSAFCLSDIPTRFIEESRCMLIFFAGALPSLDGGPMLELVKRCHAAGTTVILDASDSISADYRPIPSYLPNANLVVNQEEGRRITGKESACEILESLAHPGSFTAVTRLDGVSLLTPNGEYLDVPSPFHGRPVRDVV
ncbi:MAG TPA: PfkB family carbohydrate kinase, partial [Armatimonadota bacterium]|nr:PfkB family carbohydrate kinase [Armatimonadota bacterium]